MSIKIKRGIAVIICIGSALLLSSGTSYGVDARVGLAQTGLFHGQVAIGGLKEMIYYLEKTVDSNDPNKKFQENVSEALKRAKEAYKLFSESVNFSEKALNLITEKKGK